MNAASVLSPTSSPSTEMQGFPPTSSGSVAWQPGVTHACARCAIVLSLARELSPTVGGFGSGRDNPEVLDLVSEQPSRGPWLLPCTESG